MAINERSREAFSIGEGSVGCLLLHGFGGSPAEMEPMGRGLANAGFFVYCPVLAGHSDLALMEKASWKDWRQTAISALAELKKRLTQVFVVGFSLGGLIAYDIASTEDIRGVVSVNAPVRLVSRQVLRAQLLKMCRTGGFLSTEADADVDRVPMSCLSNLYDYTNRVFDMLPQVTVPALVIQARQDEAIDPGDGKVILERLGSRDKRIAWIDGGTHLVVLENHRGQVFKVIESFIKEHQEESPTGDEG